MTRTHTDPLPATVVNDRGKQLRRIDILKARNIEPSIIADESSRRRYAHNWEAMEDNLGERNFEDLFHLLRLIYVKDKPQQDLLNEFQHRVFDRPAMPTRGKRFLDELDDFAQLYQQLFVDRDFMEGDEEDTRFKTMMWAMVGHFHASEWKACVLSYAHSFGKEGIYTYLLFIEKVYLGHWAMAMRKDERYAVYTDLLKAIDSGRSGSDAVAAVKPSVHDIRDACLVPNFYSTGYCKYMLLRAEISASELHDPRYFTVRSIEHVLPQNPGSGSQWRKWFNQREIDDSVNKAGNLVLLSKGKNSSAGNRELTEKQEKYLKPRVSDFSRSMQVLGYSEWSKQAIDERTEAFADLILANP
ncbi:HNH endonuclease family protein [Nocardia sp. NBC_01009]|uniref:HNH endonuclease family protein n=1 Tax=Nocardia sp. NBC_01009 TaxID=2975996 RepID=UPI00386A97D5|nr:HNH endonuclease family protein [Nocardia sp. NBC_01009]